MPGEAKWACVYMLLSGKAFACVEHLKPSVYQQVVGGKAMFDPLDQRLLQKEVTDEMSESLTEIFKSKATEDESLKTLICRIA